MPRIRSSAEWTPRRLAVEILNRVDRAGAYAEPLLDRYLSAGLPAKEQDRRLLTELVYGTLRQRGRLDWIITQLYRGDPARLPAGTRNILRTGLYQLFCMDRIPAFAAVDEAVSLAGGAGLVNALLRNAIRRRDQIPYPDIEDDPVGHIAVVHSHPPWLVRRWIELWGITETTRLCAANNTVPPMAVRVNTLKANRDGAAAALRAEGFTVAPTCYSPLGLVLTAAPRPLRRSAAYESGLVLLQDEASQLSPLLVGAAPGERLLDGCAGTGSKTGQLAALMENRGLILAADRSKRKLAVLAELMERLGVTIVTARLADMTSGPDPELCGAFDRVFVDAPCSGLGTLRRNPEIKWRLKPEEIALLVRLQRAILAVAASCLRSGGTLVYSTCTVLPEENEDLVRNFLSHHSDFVLVPPPSTIPPALIDAEGFFRTSTLQQGMDAFFGAVLRRR